MHKATLLIFISLLINISIYAIPSNDKVERSFTIGFSQCNRDDSWRAQLEWEMNNTLLKYPGIELIITDAEGDSKLQIKQIENLIEKEIDILIVAPTEAEPLTAIISEIYSSGIPVILLDRKIESENYTTFIGADNVMIGVEAGRYAAKLLKGKGSIYEILGLANSSPAKDRHKGFLSEIDKYPEIDIVASSSGHFTYEGGVAAAESALKLNQNIDLVFAHNDYMALGAYSKIAQNKQDSTLFIGVDGVYGETAGIAAVRRGDLAATLLYPTGGEEAIESAIKILNGDKTEKWQQLHTVVIDHNNADMLEAQFQKINKINLNIADSRNILNYQIQKYQSQQIMLIVLFALFIIVVVLIIRSRLKHILLKQQQAEISEQNRKLKEVSEQLESVTKSKLQFFTNISHEFRTPLSLLIGPLEDLLEDPKRSKADRDLLTMMHRNAKRLLRLVNQLMIFRQLDNEKLKLQVSNNNIVDFVSDIKDSFSLLAKNRDINFNLNIFNREVMIWFDRDKLDKVLFNLLSNAFKFTPKGGTISIDIVESKGGINIEVNDSGCGIAKEYHSSIFERFYQVGGADKGSNTEGSGVGLALTRELIKLHGGELDIESSEGEGSKFIIHMNSGRDHFQDEQILLGDDQYSSPQKQIDTMDIDSVQNSTEKIVKKVANPTNKMLPLLLIVEDNIDVRTFIRSGLENDYRIVEANNGVEALEFIDQEEPELIISDVMMPEMDGIELLKRIKSNIQTSHIPVVILTARNSAEQKLEGLQEGADSYIPKPFNRTHLQIRVAKLIEGRRALREHFKTSMDIIGKETKSVTTLDKKFISKAHATIEEHISDSQFGVEELSQKLALSRVHLYRKIKNLTGLSATEFIKHVRLKRAALMIKDSGKNSTEIAFECGFSSPSYFSKCFKEFYKVSPKEYL